MLQPEAWLKVNGRNEMKSDSFLMQNAFQTNRFFCSCSVVLANLSLKHQFSENIALDWSHKFRKSDAWDLDLLKFQKLLLDGVVHWPFSTTLFLFPDWIQLRQFLVKSYSWCFAKFLIQFLALSHCSANRLVLSHQFCIFEI